MLKGKAGNSSTVTLITVDIVHTQDWVYVLRSYSPENRYSTDRPDFDRVRGSLAFLGAPAQAPPS